MGKSCDFVCNVCGWPNPPLTEIARETPTCRKCGSSIRTRAVALVLSRELFGIDLPLIHFPTLKSIRGLGISDSDTYSGCLERSFTYINTHYHREPRFDLLQPDGREFERYDFVICSEVMEHIPSAPETAFKTLARLLKPEGFLILTIPYSLEAATTEHFRGLRDFGLAEVAGRSVLIAALEGGGYEVYDSLTFHAGDGSVRFRLLPAGKTFRWGTPRLPN
ncbi:MAG: methyltransferase domain-containing protein [Bryobacterales bacterium]|nr:methyltransferase domain-containing protein [Bryobacterales bacterium]